MAIEWSKDNASEEAVNAVTHGLPFLLSFPAAFFLLRLTLENHPDQYFPCLVYCLSFSAMYLFSTLSHAVKEPAMRHKVRALDQGTIYALIAGTFTPFICSYLTVWPRVALLTFVWGAAATGFYSKVFSKHRINNMAALSYIMLGWVPAMVLFFVVSNECFGMMALGGVLYTLGVLFLQNDHRSIFFHSIWHIMVIVASLCHFAAIAAFAVLQWDRV
jgi:hemolysin III